MAGNLPQVQLEASWKEVIGKEFEAPYMQQLKDFLLREKKAKKVLYPKGKKIFCALNTTPFEQVKVVILGQDPYHGVGQAHGLCFSVLPGVALPPSLKNIYLELNRDLNIPMADHGCLIPWAKQGVLLLNSVLTVEQARAASHQGKGWEIFTDAIIERLNRERRGVVFLLWGSYAQRKGQYIDRQKHLVLQAPHPSPLSAHRGFLGCRHFSKANAYLKEQEVTLIQWQLPPKNELDPDWFN